MGSWAIVILVTASCLLPSFVGGREILNLNPHKVKELLLTQGLGIQLLNVSLEAKRQELPQVRSRFDTELTLSGDQTFDKSARASSFFGTRTDTTHWNAGLEKTFFLGTKLGAKFQNERKVVFNPSSITRTPTDPIYESAIAFEFRQPLLSNVAGRLDRAEVQKVKRSIESLDYKTKHELNALLADTLSIYWNWILSVGMLKDAEQSLKAALDFLKITVEKEKLGLVEKTDRLGAQALVSKREAEVSWLKTQVLEWESRLKSTLSLSKEVVMDAAPTNLGPTSDNEEEAMAHALQNRFDLLSLKKDAEEKQMQLVIARQKRLPILDLSSTLRLNEVKAGLYQKALGDMDNPKWQMGLELKFPLENRLGRGFKKQAELEKVRALLQIKQLEQDILHDVRQKFQAVHLSFESWQARFKAAEFQKEKLNHALVQYQRARFSAELVLQYQDDYLAASEQALRAQRDYALSLLAFKKAANKELP